MIYIYQVLIKSSHTQLYPEIGAQISNRLKKTSKFTRWALVNVPPISSRKLKFLRKTNYTLFFFTLRVISRKKVHFFPKKTSKDVKN